MEKRVERLLTLLRQSPQAQNIFNPWRDVDIENDLDPGAPAIRTAHLRHYLESRIKSARYLLIGEAIGYQGGHFSGMAMTSERILLGYLIEKGIHPEDVLPGLKPRRTSRPEIMPKGFTEPTATIVWGTLLKHGIKADEFVLWNIFPWHPFHPEKGRLSNRRPTDDDLKSAFPVIQQFLRLFPGRTVIALGRVSAGILKSMNVSCHEVRHPANAGAVKFRNQIIRILKIHERKCNCRSHKPDKAL